MTTEKTGRFGQRTLQYIAVIILLIALSGSATYAVMSDTSIHGLTVKFYDASRYCTNPTGSIDVLNFKFTNAVVYSSASLEVSLSHVTFAMASDGVPIGTFSGPDARFGPGQSVSYTPIFSNSTIDPHSQPLSSQIVLSITAQVSAGPYSTTTTTSDSALVTFPGPLC